MEKEPLNISVCSQKGGVGKSSLTVFSASWLHYVMGLNILVIDCDYPQWSINGQRERELQVLEQSDYYKVMLLRQFRQSKRKIWPIVRSTPQEAVQTSKEFMRREGYDARIVLYDLPGTVGTEGVLSLLSQMDYLFVPLKADKMVVESSLHFARHLRQFIGREAVRLREVYLFWTMVDKRERTTLYSRYDELVLKLGLKIMISQIAYRAKFNRELLPDGTGVGRSTILAAERSFFRDAGIESFVQEMIDLINSK